MIDARRSYLDVTYNNNDKAKAELEKHIKSWTYTDNLSGQIDDVQITLEDVENKWLKDWFPIKGSIITCTIHKRLIDGKTTKTKIGKFEIDEIEAKGPPTEVTIKALAVTEKSSIRGEYKYKAWEKTTLKVVAGDIAKRNGMKLYYKASDNPKKDRWEQESETDLAFLHRCCNEEGFCLKVSNQSIVILDEADYEEKDPVATIKRSPSLSDPIQVVSWTAKTTTTGIYKSAKVIYKASKKKTIKASFTPPKAPKVGRTLIIKEQVKSVAEAKRLAKKRLREANKNATTVQLAVLSEKHFDAGDTVKLSGFGKFDGKYIITQVTISNLPVTLQLRRCLEGY